MIAIAVRPIAMPTTPRRISGLATARIVPGALTSITQIPATIMNRPSPAASIRYSGQWLPSAARARSMSAPRCEFGIERHAAIDEQGDPVDVITVVRCKPDSRSRNVFWLADTLVRDEVHQRLIRDRRRPGSRIDRRARCAGR